MEGIHGYEASDLDNGGENRTSTSSSHGWQKVTHLKKRSKRGSQPGSANFDSASEIFRGLENDAEDRRKHRQALVAAANAPVEPSHSESDVDGEDDDRPADSKQAANGQSKSSKLKKSKKPKVSVADAAAAIDPSDLSAFLAGISDSFSELPGVQLMRCADYFGRAFNSVSPAQFGWNKVVKESSVAKAVEIPLCHLPEHVNKIASDWLSAKPADAISEFILWALNDVMSDTQDQQGCQKGTKGIIPSGPAKSKAAVLVVLALVLRRQPDLLVQKAALLRSSPQYRGQEKLATLAWAYGQVAQGDLVSGMYLWVHNLLPLAVGKSSTPASRDIALQFIESVLLANLKNSRPVLLNGISQRGEGLVSPAALDSLMRAAFPPDVAHTKETMRFFAIYHIVRELALGGCRQNKAAKSVAQQLLPLSLASASEDVSALSHEACANFIWSLSQNSDCFKQWERLHLENLKGSTRVLNYLYSEWKNNVVQLSPLDDLKSTMRALRVKHRTAMDHAKGNMELEELIKSADNRSKDLLKKMVQTGDCFKATATIVAGLSMAYGFYLLSPDVNPWGWDGNLLLSKTHFLTGS